MFYLHIVLINGPWSISVGSHCNIRWLDFEQFDCEINHCEMAEMAIHLMWILFLSSFCISIQLSPLKRITLWGFDLIHFDCFADSIKAIHHIDLLFIPCNISNSNSPFDCCYIIVITKQFIWCWVCYSIVYECTRFGLSIWRMGDENMIELVQEIQTCSIF